MWLQQLKSACWLKKKIKDVVQASRGGVKLGHREGWILPQPPSTQLHPSVLLLVHSVCPCLPRLHVNCPISEETASLAIIVSNTQVRKPDGPSESQGSTPNPEGWGQQNKMARRSPFCNLGFRGGQFPERELMVSYYTGDRTCQCSSMSQRASRTQARHHWNPAGRYRPVLTHPPKHYKHFFLDYMAIERGSLLPSLI